MRKLLLLLPALAILAGCGGDPADPGPEPDERAYYAIEIDGFLEGWCSLETSSYPPVYLASDESWFPAEPFRSAAWSQWDYDGTALGSFYWSRGTNFQPWLQARLAREDRGVWSWVVVGAGELDLIHDLAPAEIDPRVLDPVAPLSYALLGQHWDHLGRPDSLDLDLFVLGEPLETPRFHEARLIHEATEAFYESFRLHYEESAAHFKLLIDEFPAPYACSAEGVALRYWDGDEPPHIDDFAPDFPGPEGYTTETIEPAGLAGEACIPEGQGPFPAVLMVADDGPADRDSGALFGFLAHDLARQGRAVWRYDKLGTGNSLGELDTLGLAQRRANIAAAWSEMAGDPRVDPGRLFLLGHGEGAALALELVPELQPAGVIALAPWRNRPDELREIPEAEIDQFRFLDWWCYGGKHRDKLTFDPKEYLPLCTAPVFLAGASWDRVVPEDDVIEQAALLGGEVQLTIYGDLNHAFTIGRADLPPPAYLSQQILAWMEGLAP